MNRSTPSSLLPLSKESLDYLQTRGYIPDLIRKEEINLLPKGENFLPDTDRTFQVLDTTLCFTCRSMSGSIAGYHTVRTLQKEYRYHQLKNKPHLPILYGAASDYEKLYLEGEMFLVEGVFDRIALKRCLPDAAVFARLSKGTSGQLAIMIRRYARRVWLTFDQDEAGRSGAEKAETRIGGKVEMLKLNYPAKDPAELLARRGLNRAREILTRQTGRLAL